MCNSCNERKNFSALQNPSLNVQRRTRQNAPQPASITVAPSTMAHQPKPTVRLQHITLQTEIQSEKARAFYACHLLFSHIQLTTLQTMIRRQPLNLSDIQTLPTPKFDCSGCKQRKEGPKPHKPTIDNYELGSALCCDVAGLNRPPSVEEKRDLIVFIDSGSRFGGLIFANPGK